MRIGNREITKNSKPYFIADIAANHDHAAPYVNTYKIGSGDITWTEMLAYIAAKNKPVLLATGASDMADVDRAMIRMIMIEKGQTINLP